MSAGPGQLRSAFGLALRDWRRARGLTQLDLACRADASQRHLSFLETGRSRPGPDIVLRLADVLDVPLRERNRLLALAGLPPAFREHALDDAMTAPFRSAMQQILQKHEPLPAMVLDGWWNVVDSNHSARRLFVALGASPGNMAQGLLAPGKLRAAIENWEEVAVAVLYRLRRELAQSPFDPQLSELVRQAENEVGQAGLGAMEPEDRMVVCPTFRVGAGRIRTFSVISYFNAPRDVTLSELRVEQLFPRDEASERSLLELVGAVG